MNVDSPPQTSPTPDTFRLNAPQLQQLFDVLMARGYTVMGPTARDGAIVLDALTHTSQLPVGLTEEQEAGTYRLLKRNDSALFGFANGPQSWKKFLHPPRLHLFSAHRTDSGFTVESTRPPPPQYAFLGIRACDLHAIRIQETVFQSATQPDPTYQETLDRAFLIAVQCTQAGKTCFCVSMKTGPRSETGFDLALTEVIETDSSENGHYFVVEIGSSRGAEVLSDLQAIPARPEETAEALRRVKATEAQMGRRLNTDGLKALLAESATSERWEAIAKRCLSCANCTMVCPTCFCTSVEDTTDISGDHADRWRRWDSCFTLDFSYLHGGSVRNSGASRYRQWLTHKLSAWHDQFGTSGCVGCGRCISWCPVGIDLTEEAEGFRLATLARPVPVSP